VREVAAAAFEQLALLDQPRHAVAFEATARLALPGIGDERLAALLFERGDDSLLQRQELLANALGVDGRRFQRLIAR
jgi:hypothetical protein